MLTFGFRAFFLFPLRLLLLSSSFGFAAFWCLIVYFFSLTKQRKTWIAVTYCRLFCAGTGVIAKYHNEEKIPKQPGIAVSISLKGIVEVYEKKTKCDICYFRFQIIYHQMIYKLFVQM